MPHHGYTSLAVGGPLRFPDLTDSFLETDQNFTEVLLRKLQQELSKYLQHYFLLQMYGLFTKCKI